MVHVHTQKPNEPSLGTGAHVRLGLALTPTFILGEHKIFPATKESYRVYIGTGNQNSNIDSV
jgi:hypothetical protein